MKTIDTVHSYMWLSLLALGVIWGVLTGLSLGVPGFWLDPTAAIFGCFGTMTLGITLKKLQKEGIKYDQK